MDPAAASLPASIILAIALLAVFLSYLVALSYLVRDNFRRTRASMTSFFFFIVATLTLSFWHYALATLPYSIPAFTMGAILGHFVGVAGAQERRRHEGDAHYREHFAHLHVRGIKDFTWWTFANFYTVAGALALINLIGFSTVLVPNEALAILTSAVGALLLGTIAPYLVHLWSISHAHHASNTTSDR